MADMTTYFAGLKFRNPVVPGSGPPVRDWREAKKAIDGGVGALVTKTISVVAASPALRARWPSSVTRSASGSRSLARGA